MRIDIVTGCDGEFAQHLAAMLLSLADTNPQHSFSIFILWNGTAAEKEKLSQVVASTPFAVFFVEINYDSLAGLMLIGTTFTKMTYARLLISDLLPREIDRILYLDGDILVRGDIGELWTTDLGGKTLGAVADLPRYPFNHTLGLPPEAPYFNAGVLLIDLRRWRELKIGERALTFAREHQDRLRWQDQCALNFVLHDDWVALDRAWNFQSLDIGRFVSGYMRFGATDWRRLATARVVHFNGPSKPWHYLNEHPLKSEYLRYRSRTPWPLRRFEDRHPRSIVGKFVLRYAPGLLTAYASLQKLIGRAERDVAPQDASG
jgi:lipopolysaccharide biosynthesis glycosyltransferase